MSRFIKAPVPDQPETTPTEQAASFLSGFGIETGLPGAVMIGAGSVLLLIALVQIVRVIRARRIELAEGEVVGTENAPGGGFHPVIRFTDGEGQRRRFVAPMVIPADVTGQRLRVRIDGRRPEVAARPPSPVSEALSMVLPLILGGVVTVTGITGRLAGIVPVPFF